jgi:hypothetical protein
MAEPRSRSRLDDGEIADRLERLDHALGLLERTPGATAQTALEAVTMLTGVYGEALARVLDSVAGDRPLVDALLADELVGHLFVLHDVHPEPVERRVTRALKGTGAELTALQEGTARIRLAGGGGCGCNSAGSSEEIVRDAVLAAAPELEQVVVVRPDAVKTEAAFVPLDAVLRSPACRKEPA